jgi:hypothetical protein
VSTAQGILLVIGAVLQFGGIVLIAFPDFLPHGQRLSRWLGHRARMVINRVRRLFGMKPLQKIVYGSGTVKGSASVSGSGLVSISDDATQEEKIAFLLQRDQEAQQAINTLSRRVGDLEEERLDRRSCQACTSWRVTVIAIATPATMNTNAGMRCPLRMIETATKTSTAMKPKFKKMLPIGVLN